MWEGASGVDRTYMKKPGMRDQGRKSGVDHTYLRNPECVTWQGRVE